MEKKKGFIIQKIGYEYNDEYYYRSGDGGGNPITVILNRELAKEKFFELEVESWRGTFLGYYGYELSELSDNEEEFEKALKSMDVDIDDWQLEIPKEATYEQIKRVILASKIRMHEIIEIEIEDYPTVSDDEFAPNESMLDNQEIISKMSQKNKIGIFDSVDDFTSPDIKPTEVPDEVSINDIKSAVKDTENDFLSIKEEIRNLQEEERLKVKNFFIKGMNYIFENYPEVKIVSWTQYTPYFNDGEECVFRANTDYFEVNGFSDYDDEGEPGLINVIDYDYRNGKVYKYHKGEEIYNAIKNFLNQLDKEDYKTMFGDHAKITVRKDEITVEEYEHE